MDKVAYLISSKPLQSEFKDVQQIFLTSDEVSCSFIYLEFFLQLYVHLK